MIAAAHEPSLILFTDGLDGNVIRLHVPLVISYDELDRGLSILERALGSRGNIES
jgi:4-aminobutyrate aminotransferase/(S)-3-amino-2-methylpropionate transaminase